MLLQPLLRSALTLLPCIRVILFPCSRVTVSPCSRVTLFSFFLFALSPFLSAQVGKVGINTTSPAAMLHVKDSSVVFTGPAPLPATPGAPPVSGPGTRMMWYTDKAAFRAGSVNGTQWDRDSIGSNSAAFGTNSKAKGASAFVGGGINNNASGPSSFVAGSNNTAIGVHAFIGGGNGNEAFGSSSFVSGNGNITNAPRTFVGGGVNNMASGPDSFLGGGNANTASGVGSFAGGGENLLAKSFGEAVFGLNNTDYDPASLIAFNSNDRLFVIGNGASAAARSNAVTILKNGNTGIGTDTPDRRLHVANGNSGGTPLANAIAVFEDDQSTTIHLLAPSASGTGIIFGDEVNSQDGSIQYNNATAPNGLLFRTNGGGNRMVITDNGDVGIGTTAPSARLEVNADVVKKINGGSWTASSDRRLKQDIKAYTEGLHEVMAIRPVTFRYNALSGYDTASEHIGVIAQELQAVAPHMVSEFEQNGDTYLQVDNSAMTYMLINAVKEQQAIIEGLKTTNDEQAKRLSDLEQDLADLRTLIAGLQAPASTTAQVPE